VEAITAGDATDLHVADVRRLGGGFTRPVHAAAARRDQPYQPYLLVVSPSTAAHITKAGQAAWSGTRTGPDCRE
jgi:hypothetical protein